jgi:hypothetical protein
MGTWSPLDLQFPDLTTPAGTRLLPMQELENYIDDAFEKINQLKILGKFYVVNGAEYANLGDALNDLWSKGINNVEILLRSGVNYTLPNITIASSRQVIIRGIGGRANLTVSGGNWYGTVILENVNVTFTGAVNATNGTNTPTIVFRNCSITLSQVFGVENGTLVLRDCSFTNTGDFPFLFNADGFLLCDNVNATPQGMFVGSNDANVGRLRLFFLNSTIRRQATSLVIGLIGCYGSLFAYNTVFDISQSTANPSSDVSIVFADGRGSNVADNYFFLYFSEIRGNGSDRNFRSATTGEYGFVYCINCRFINTKRFVTRQFNSSLWATFVFIGCHFEYNRSYTSFLHENTSLLLNGFYNAFVSGNRFYYTGGTKNNGVVFVRIQSPRLCIFTNNYAEGGCLLLAVDGLENASNTIVPFLLVGNNVIRNCFNKCIWLSPSAGHVFVMNNLIFNDYEQSWNNNGVYDYSDSSFNFYGAGIVVQVVNALVSYTRNQTQDDPLNIVVSGNVIMRRLLNAIMLYVSGTTNLFTYRVVVTDNTIIDCDPERLLSASEWAIYNSLDNKRKGVGVLLDAQSTTAPAQKMEPIIMNNRFINTRYGVYQGRGKHGYYDGTKYVYHVVGNYYYRIDGNVASYLNPDSATDVYWFDNIGMDATAGANANVIRTQQQGFALPSSVPTNEGSYIFPRTKQYDCAGGFAGGYPFGYIPSKVDVFDNLTLPSGTVPTYAPITTPQGVSFKTIQLAINQDLRFKVIPRLFGSKTRNYRRMFIDVVVYSTGAGGVTFNVVRINPSTGAETTVVNGSQINFTGAGIYNSKVNVEATQSGFWIYAVRITNIGGTPPPTVSLLGLWIGVDEYYDYGTDSV